MFLSTITPSQIDNFLLGFYVLHRVDKIRSLLKKIQKRDHLRFHKKLIRSKKKKNKNSPTSTIDYYGLLGKNIKIQV